MRVPLPREMWPHRRVDMRARILLATGDGVLFRRIDPTGTSWGIDSLPTADFDAAYRDPCEVTS